MTPSPAATEHSFIDGFHDAIHATLPHSSVALDAISLGFVVVAALTAGVYQLIKGKRWPPEQFVRVGFAAAPIPIYIFLPFLPYDKDLTDMFADERILLALAAASGLMWTVREIRSLFKAESQPPRSDAS